MASIQQTAKGYRAQVYVLGVRDSETFPTKREATAWASKRETELRSQTAGKAATTKTLADALRRYGDEVSPKRRGWRWELLRLDAFNRSTLPTMLRLSAIRAEHIAQWRDDRLREVEPGTVLREIGLLSAVFEVARREWRWMEANPVKDIRKPPEPNHRTRLISWTEIKAMLRQMDHHPGRKPETLTHAIAICFLAALRTGMRAGELTGLDWGRVYPKYVRLLTSKTGAPRDVPLSPKAARVIERMRGFHHEQVFAVRGPTLDAMFRRARQRAGLEGFTFHDSRHTAATWIGRSGKLSMLELCKMFGWKDPKHALIYFNPTASDLAAKL